MGFEVGFNTMYMSKWHDYEGFLDKLPQLDGVADLFCMVDSFGGGISLFGGFTRKIDLTLVETKKYNGIVEVIYNQKQI